MQIKLFIYEWSCTISRFDGELGNGTMRSYHMSWKIESRDLYLEWCMCLCMDDHRIHVSSHENIAWKYLNSGLKGIENHDL